MGRKYCIYVVAYFNTLPETEWRKSMEILCQNFRPTLHAISCSYSPSGTHLSLQFLCLNPQRSRQNTAVQDTMVVVKKGIKRTALYCTPLSFKLNTGEAVMVPNSLKVCMTQPLSFICRELGENNSKATSCVDWDLKDEASHVKRDTEKGPCKHYP